MLHITGDTSGDLTREAIILVAHTCLHFPCRGMQGEKRNHAGRKILVSRARIRSHRLLRIKLLPGEITVKMLRTQVEIMASED